MRRAHVEYLLFWTMFCAFFGFSWGFKGALIGSWVGLIWAGSTLTDEVMFQQIGGPRQRN